MTMSAFDALAARVASLEESVYGPDPSRSPIVEPVGEEVPIKIDKQENVTPLSTGVGFHDEDHGDENESGQVPVAV